MTAPTRTGGALQVTAPDGVPEIEPGSDLAGALLAVVELLDGDVLVVTSKVVSKAEGRIRDGDRDSALAEETVRVVARRGPTSIVRTRHGLTMAAAGIDASNVQAGRIVLLPLDPDASARRLREEVRRRTGHNVGVIVTDTAGRAWREGQTDIAVGAAGLRVVEDFAGRVDGYGNPLAVTAPAVADEIAGAAELAQGKLGGRPCAVVRGRADLVLPAGEHGPGAVALVRREGGDLFGYGAREAVVRALAGAPADRLPFGSPASPAELRDAVQRVLGPDAHLDAGPDAGPDADPDPAELRLTSLTPAARPVLAALVFAHGWSVEATSDDQHPVVLRPFVTTP
ncbi:coenzyme F420-0:L-glutamate ligase [Nocardioides pacificus]